MKILSVDWDYFINASAEQRYAMFPDGGNENLPLYLTNLIWVSHYNGELEKIGIKENDLDIIKNVIANNFDSIMIADSHKHIYNFIEENLDDYSDTINVTNVDFHHDLYGINDDSRGIDCGNWMVNLFKNYNCEYNWVNQDDSDKHLDNCNFCKINLKEIKDIEKENYDLLYICRSSVWSPPHLDKYFIDAFNPLIMQNKIEVQYETDIFNNRYNEEFLDMVNQNKMIMENLKNRQYNIEK